MQPDIHYRILVASAGISTLYDRYVKAQKLSADAAQEAIVGHLQALYDALCLKPKQGVLTKLIAPKRPKPRGVYIWGDVGRGKSLLMDMFFASIPFPEKERIHFYSLMLGLHKAIHALRQQNVENPAQAAAQELAKKYRLLCIDEFQVTDVADAMLLHGLFTTLLKENVTIVITSNRPPDSLYLTACSENSWTS